MNAIIKLEELGLMVLGIYLYSLLHYTWWWFFAFLLLPDVSMIGYIFGNKVGAYMYNFIHHRGLSIMIYLAGIYTDNSLIQLIGIILFVHSSFDRLFGYGLKYEQGFKYTHLGKIGHDKVESKIE